MPCGRSVHYFYSCSFYDAIFFSKKKKKFLPNFFSPHLKETAIHEFPKFQILTIVRKPSRKSNESLDKCPSLLLQYFAVNVPDPPVP